MVTNLIGEKLGLDEERRAWLLKGRAPEFDLHKDVKHKVTFEVVSAE